MSSDEYIVGTLTPIEIKVSIEETAKEILQSFGTVKPKYYKTYLEFLMSEYYRKYFEYNGKLYEVYYVDMDPCDDIFEANASENGHIDFTLKFYNGGCSMNEALEYAMEKLENE